MPTVVPFLQNTRSPSPPPAPTDQLSLVRLMMELSATYDTVADAVKDDPQRRDQLRNMTKSFMCDIARIGRLQT